MEKLWEICERYNKTKLLLSMEKLQQIFYPARWETRTLGGSTCALCGYLIHCRKVKSQTVKSYVSALKNVLMDIGQEINEDKFILSSLTKACTLQNDQVWTRLPIQHKLLGELVKFMQDHFLMAGQFYLATLYSTLFVTSYYGLFHILELTITPSNHAVWVADVHIGKNKPKFMFVLRSSKTHNQGNKPQIIKISTEDRLALGKICPYKWLKS